MKLDVAAVALRLGRRLVLRGVDFAAAAGEVVVVLGPNGAGKTTLLRVAAGLVRPSAGRVLWDGNAPQPALRRRVGYVGHRSFLYDNLTALENLQFFGQLFGVPDADHRARELLAAEGLTLFSHEAVRGFSRGMQQRLALCRAWLAEPDLVLLDEPWTGLDTDSVARWEERVARLRAAGGTAVVVLHDLAAAQRLGDRSVRLADGRVAAAAKETPTRLVRA